MTRASAVRRIGGTIFCLVNLWLAVVFTLSVHRGLQAGASWVGSAIFGVVLFGYCAVAFGLYAVTGRRLFPIPAGG